MLAVLEVEIIELTHAYSYTLSYRGFQAEGCLMDPNSEALKTLARLHRQVSGEEVGVKPITATTDARFYALYAIVQINPVILLLSLLTALQFLDLTSHAVTTAYLPPAMDQSLLSSTASMNLSVCTACSR